ncbi:MAG: formylmethanofuran dehydrogenase subunit B [Planctomicrobium sp.]|jgi:formylmethanofuran dehydrogenase subunit B|nr:formylmethanofuran dehydrogenase subunit B [Planctomicrobium sp.]
MTVDSKINETVTHNDISCTLCGCVCDDLQINVHDNSVVGAKNACVLAEPWLLKKTDYYDSPCDLNGQAATLEESINKAARLIDESRNPLVYGLSSSSTPGQRAACELADYLGAVIDTSASTCHAPSIMAVQRIGESTCSLGEIKNRSDLVIFWGSNPVESHPRHLERYSGGEINDIGTDKSRKRFLVVVDTVKTETAELADLFIQIEPGKDFEVLWALRGLVKGVSIDKETFGGVEKATLIEFADRMMNCQHGAIFFGLGLAYGTTPHLKVEALLSLVTDLHQHTRFVARRMRRYGDVAGADSVLCWQTGYPFSVSLNRGYPRYNPGEFSAGDMLAANEPDLAILVGTDGLRKLSNKAQDCLAQIPTILLAHDDEATTFTPTVKIRVGTYGVHLTGTAYRMDETPIPLRPFLETELPSDDEVIKTLTRKLLQKKLDE